MFDFFDDSSQIYSLFLPGASLHTTHQRDGQAKRTFRLIRIFPRRSTMLTVRKSETRGRAEHGWL
ncbi:hypothetical protein VDO80_19650, partial [Xanthomonas campestris pv. campestris]|nr:hypothetical protein [Xanthomonas campestris pv. campestris]